VAGDYNRDNAVDAADYVVWRKYSGTTTPLANDPIGGTIGPAHYQQWRTHFGQTVGGGAPLGNSVTSPIPEPATATTVFVALLTILYRSSRRVMKQF
jgi:hypothetical protein